jgi:hypothetical protein
LIDCSGESLGLSLDSDEVDMTRVLEKRCRSADGHSFKGTV